MALIQGKSLIFSYFLFLYFFCFLIWGGRNFSTAAVLGENYHDKKNLGERIPQGSDIDIFCVFSDGSGKN